MQTFVGCKKENDAGGIQTCALWGQRLACYPLDYQVDYKGRRNFMAFSYAVSLP